MNKTGLAAAAIASLALSHPDVGAAATTTANAASGCAQLAPALAKARGAKMINSALVPASGADIGYCRVDLRYGTSSKQNINIIVLLPLSTTDGGAGALHGSWNGRTESMGGGGCAGNIFQTPPQLEMANAELKQGYVVSGNDLGHSGGDCEPGINEDGTYNKQFINDFIRDGVKQQVLWSKAIAKAYYGTAASYNYWNGCSTGGRQGYVIAQELGKELDGIAANSPAIYWTRFQTAQMWGQLVMHQLTGGPIAPAKLAQARMSAVAACDATDGIKDGIIEEPRSCRFSARANICGTATAPAQNCLSPTEADAIDLIWDGPKNAQHNSVWFGLGRGSDFAGLDGPVPFQLGVTQFQWDEHNRGFDWQSVKLDDYARVAEAGSRNIADLTDTDGPLDTFKAHGGKLLTFVGMNDQLIFPGGVIHYYRQMASRYGDNGKPDYARLQQFYRLFIAPGVGHCGGGVGPAPG
jgi:hypothetical protein